MLAFVLVACLLASFAAASGKKVQDASPQDEAAARQAYIAAKQHYDRGELEPALASFQRSYGIVASPNSHLMVAKVLAELSRYPEAFDAMQATMREAEAAVQLGPSYAKKYDKTLQTATAKTAELRTKVGFVRVVIDGGPLPVGAVVTVNGTVVEDLARATTVEPGPVQVTLETKEGTAEGTERVRAGTEVDVRLQLPRRVETPPPPQPSVPQAPETTNIPRVLGYTSAAIGGAGLVVFAVFGALTLDQFGQLEDECPMNRCPATSQPNIEDGKQYQTIANVGVTIGVAGGIAALALFLVDATTESAYVRPSPNGATFGVSF